MRASAGRRRGTADPRLQLRLQPVLRVRPGLGVPTGPRGQHARAGAAGGGTHARTGRPGGGSVTGRGGRAAAGPPGPAWCTGGVVMPLVFRHGAAEVAFIVLLVTWAVFETVMRGLQALRATGPDTR